MTSARVGIRHLLEMIAAVGCGLALAKLCHGDRRVGSLGPRFVVEPVLAGTAAVGALALAWERLRRRASRPWGLGRWAWAVAGGYVLAALLDNAALFLGFSWKRGGPISGSALLGSTLGTCTTLFYPQVWYVLLVGWLLTRKATTLQDPDPDSRELTGRLLLAAILAWGLAYRIQAVVGG
jgi:hypothetical protein